MTTAIAEGIDAIYRRAELLHRSGLLPQHIRSAQQAFAIITMGQELGIGPWAAINGIHVIQGKPTLSPALMLALINRSGQLAAIEIDGDNKSCTVTMERRGRAPHSETFTMAAASAMGLADKATWKKQPDVMLKWRAVSACARVVFPDVIIGVYTSNEIDPDIAVDNDGELVVDTDTPVSVDEPHWMDSDVTRMKFWTFTKNLGLTKDQVHAALGVGSVYDYNGTRAEAAALLRTYAETARDDELAESAVRESAGGGNLAKSPPKAGPPAFSSVPPPSGRDEAIAAARRRKDGEQ